MRLQFFVLDHRVTTMFFLFVASSRCFTISCNHRDDVPQARIFGRDGPGGSYFLKPSTLILLLVCFLEARRPPKQTRPMYPGRMKMDEHRLPSWPVSHWNHTATLNTHTNFFQKITVLYNSELKIVKKKLPRSASEVYPE